MNILWKGFASVLRGWCPKRTLPKQRDPDRWTMDPTFISQMAGDSTIECPKCGQGMHKVWRYPKTPTSSGGIPLTPFSARRRMDSEQFGSIMDALDEIVLNVTKEKAYHCANCGHVQPE